MRTEPLLYNKNQAAYDKVRSPLESLLYGNKAVLFEVPDVILTILDTDFDFPC
jgi:hypothetical protein